MRSLLEIVLWNLHCDEMEYTAGEYTDMLIVYGVAGENANVAARLYAERFPNRRHPNRNTILRCIRRAQETGCMLLNRQFAGAQLRVRVEDEERILRAFEENPGNSVRHVARALGLSRYVVHNTLRRNGLHPYHYQRVQQLLPGDEEQRIYFCEGIFIIIFLFNVRVIFDKY